jgi:2-hydroxychromene-2-carboxylate isomerase
MSRSLAVTFDYRCPFAFNGHAAVINAVRAGADLDVRFVPFSLDQVHVPEGEVPMWERPSSEWGSGLLALCFGIAVRHDFPEHFLDAHIALFEARHVLGAKLNEVEVLRGAVERAGLDADKVHGAALRPDTLATIAREHTEMVDRHAVFGVPTFVEGEEAVFVRFMERGNVDDLHRALDLLRWTAMNEFKRTRIPR